MSNSLVEQVYILWHSLHTNDRSNALFIMDRATWDQLVQLLREHTRDDYWAQVLERGPENGDTLLGLPVVVTEAVTGLVLVTPVLPTPIEHSDYTNAVDEFYEGWNASENVTSPRSTDAPVNTNVVHEQTQAINEEFGWENGDTAQEVCWDEIDMLDRQVTCDQCYQQVCPDEAVFPNGEVFCFSCVEAEARE